MASEHSDASIGGRCKSVNLDFVDNGISSVLDCEVTNCGICRVAPASWSIDGTCWLKGSNVFKQASPRESSEGENGS